LGSFKTKAEASQALKKAEVAKAQGTLVLGKAPTVREWFTTWLAGRTRIAYRTRVDYEQTFQAVYPYIGEIRLDQLTEHHLGDMWRKLADGIAADETRRDPLAATTLRKRYVHVNAALRAAVKSRHVQLTYNPAEGTKPERGARKEINPLTEGEVQKLLAVTKNDPEYPVWVMLLYTGCRRSECLALRWRDVDFERGRVSIRGSVHRETGKGLVFGPTKTKKDRMIDLRPEIIRALQIHRARQAETRLAAGPTWNDLGYVFTRADGHAMDESGVQRKFTAACR
jgi:integrase